MADGHELSYRREIDGLRAVAILPVALNHAHVQGFGGGYVGVDIFFVLSGYLITRIIAREIDADKFTLAKFYERRIRRIFPALVFVLAVSLVCGALFQFPNELSGLAKSAIATAIFSSNIYFYSTSNYFSDASDWEPLLHTWSLGIEEQFYILFPMLLLFFEKRSRRLAIAALTTIAVASFALGSYQVFQHSDAAFYLLPGRAWELLLGAILGLQAIPKLKARLFNEAAAVAGLAAIAWAIHHYNFATEFPGVAALPPCLGAAIIIHTNENKLNVVGRVLATPPFVFIGAISYPLYLWHWPVIVFYRLSRNVVELTSYEPALVTLVSILLAWLTVIFIEAPFRRKRMAASTRSLFVAGGTAMAALALISAGVVSAGGLQGMRPANAEAMAGYLSYDDRPSFRRGECFITYQEIPERDFRPEVCLHRDEGKKNYLLIGDSHAAHLWYGLQSEFGDINFMQATAAGCKPLQTMGQPNCLRFYKKLFDEFLPEHHVDAILVAARWHMAELAEIPQWVASLKHYADKVIVIGPTVEYRSALPRILANRIVNPTAKSPDQELTEGIAEIDEAMADVVKKAGAVYVSAYRTLCRDTECVTLTPDGVPVQFDYGHLTAAGSIYMASRWQAEGALTH